jgi:hypothetical protein
MTYELRLQHAETLRKAYTSVNIVDGIATCIMCGQSINCPCAAHGYDTWFRSLTQWQITDICAKMASRQSQ